MAPDDGGPPPILLGNEFARVRLEVEPGPDGDRLRISAIRTKRTRTLSAEEVEGLTRLPVSAYLAALETPFGPEPDLAFSAEFPVAERDES
ncbi:hypothetical protein [Amycolatopsis sp. NPDC051903]|uniref:hypothetical protein n=1 Tax=Amycolatopsis sp. NPDC051903 TaxID=3363936 RepID=UPI0037988EA1